MRGAPRVVPFAQRVKGEESRVVRYGTGAFGRGIVMLYGVD